MARLANTEPPKSIDEARARLLDTNVQIETLNEALAARFRYNEDDGMPLSPEEHLAWRKKASGARNWFLREQAICQQYITDYEKDVKAEEAAERHAQALKTQRKNAEDKRARAEALRKRDEENNRWRAQMIEQYGTAKLPPDIARAEMIRLEQLRLEAKQAELARIGTSQKRAEQNKRHKEWVRMLNITDPVNELDPMNLLAHAYQLITRLRQRHYEDFTDEDLAVLGIIQERYLIIKNLEDDALDTCGILPVTAK